MKNHFWKKILSLVLALMCIATIGVVSASAAELRPVGYDSAVTYTPNSMNEEVFKKVVFSPFNMGALSVGLLGSTFARNIAGEVVSSFN